MMGTTREAKQSDCPDPRHETSRQRTQWTKGNAVDTLKRVRPPVFSGVVMVDAMPPDKRELEMKASSSRTIGVRLYLTKSLLMVW